MFCFLSLLSWVALCPPCPNSLRSVALSIWDSASCPTRPVALLFHVPMLSFALWSHEYGWEVPAVHPSTDYRGCQQSGYNSRVKREVSGQRDSIAVRVLALHTVDQVLYVLPWAHLSSCRVRSNPCGHCWLWAKTKPQQKTTKKPNKENKRKLPGLSLLFLVVFRP